MARLLFPCGEIVRLFNEPRKEGTLVMSLLNYMHALPVLCVAHKYKIHLIIFTLQSMALELV